MTKIETNKWGYPVSVNGKPLHFIGLDNERGLSMWQTENGRTTYTFGVKVSERKSR